MTHAAASESDSIETKPATDGSGWLGAGFTAAVVANLLVIGTAIYAAVIRWRLPDLYYTTSQEDQHVEWGTFFAFVAAAVLFILAAVRQWRTQGKLPWFLAGVALFCVLVAGEEISWGQRLLGYVPPDYFLEKNFQQEFNIHNVTSNASRQLVVNAVLLGYGVVLPLLGLVSPLRRLFLRMAIHPTPAFIIPSFAVTFAIWITYPWDYSGEWVELMMGLGFLFSAQAIHRSYRTAAEAASPRREWLAYLTSWVIMTLLGVAAAVASDQARAADPERVAAAHAEVEALLYDALRLDSPCQDLQRIHKRIHSYVVKYGAVVFYSGEFADLKMRGLSTTRARYFIDPWNTPYWLLCLNRDGESGVVIYSFGPNRRRESSDLELAGDDIGLVGQLNPSEDRDPGQPVVPDQE